VFQNIEQAQEFIKENEIQAVDLKYCDLLGRWHHITIPTSRFDQDLMSRGIGFDGSSVGLKSVKAGDMVVVPDLSTGFVDPFWETPVLSFIGKILTADTRETFENDPRNIANNAEAFLRETGIATQSEWGPEFEFYVFDEVVYENLMHKAGYELFSYEADWSSTSETRGATIPLHGGYHVAPPKDRFHNLRNEIVAHLEKIGVPVKYHHHEVGSAGQMEIETSMMGMQQSGDAILMIKYVTKMAAQGNNKAATFMPKPLYGEAGSGMHFHQKLLKDGDNLFYDPEGYACLSKTAQYYIGGLLHHGAAVLAFTNPSTNSYRRLVPGFEAPVNAFYSLGNRSAAIRIPKYALSPASARMEFRPPDATCNPYLALAAMLMAGVDGIRNQIDPSESGYGPIDADIFSWTEEQRAGITPLPTSLEAAMQALEEDHQFLLEGHVFTEELIQTWIDYKRSGEADEVRTRPHPFEMSLYFDV
jgi:glutamine synthetase